MQIYNTLSRTIEEFKPIDPSEVRMYTCGPTVYREIHIGNFRTYLTTDLLKRILQYNNYKATSVMNITDVGHIRYSAEYKKQIDPIIQEALDQGLTPLQIAQQYTEKFLKDSQKLNILPADVLPRASEHIKEMIEVIKVLIDKGYAYETSGNVYFNVKKFKDYGKLSGNTLDKMDQLLEAVRVSTETDKKDSADFALWKKAESDRAMKWPSPWALPDGRQGEGYPGWHIECSTMSIKYLGEHFDTFGKLSVNGERSRTIDIHAGGEDLIFPHHENEIAQSEALYQTVQGKTCCAAPFVNYWVHTNYLLVDDEKMSRSKRNVYTISDLVRKGFNPLAFRYLTYLTHYRARMNFTWQAMQSAQTALDNIYEIATSLPVEGRKEADKFESEFFKAINQDINMPKAISILWSLLRAKRISDEEKALTLYRMDDVLGLKIKETARASKNIPLQIRELVQKREELRKQKKFTRADHLRNRIEKEGYVIKDTEKGTKILRKI